MSLPDFIALAPGDTPIRRLVDPGHTLPSVLFRRNSSLVPEEHPGYDGEPSYGFHICAEAGPAGMAALAEHPETGDYHFADIRLDDEYLQRPRGIGLASYVLAIETAHSQGRAFAADATLTPKAVKVWRRFERLGIVDVEVPFTDLDLDLTDDGQPHYEGIVRIPPLQF